jgi:ADP-ribose pyrophosphatase YjhB (NUDIX family)
MIKLKDLLFEGHNDTEDTAGVWISYDNRCMLCLREDGRWSIPKGHIQIGEEPIDGALRELVEETQIMLNGTPELVEKVKKNNGDGYFHIFRFETDKKFIPRLDIEHTKWGYFSYDNLPTPLDEKLENILNKY